MNPNAFQNLPNLRRPSTPTHPKITDSLSGWAVKRMLVDRQKFGGLCLRFPSERFQGVSVRLACHGQNREYGAG